MVNQDTFTSSDVFPERVQDAASPSFWNLKSPEILDRFGQHETAEKEFRERMHGKMPPSSATHQIWRNMFVTELRISIIVGSKAGSDHFLHAQIVYRPFANRAMVLRRSTSSCQCSVALVLADRHDACMDG
jgi:hypothetical protein